MNSNSTLPDARSLRLLYFLRTAFSVVWVVLVLVFAGSSATTAHPIAVVLLVIYPLWDAFATTIDLRADRRERSHVPQVLNIAFDVAAAIGIGLGFIGGENVALGVFGAWAFLSGAVQLVLGLRRRRQGGQWAMIASGGISVIAGVSFVLSAVSGNGAITSVAGYSLFGAVWYLIAALFLTRTITSRSRHERSAT